MFNKYGCPSIFPCAYDSPAYWTDISMCTDSGLSILCFVLESTLSPSTPTPVVLIAFTCSQACLPLKTLSFLKASSTSQRSPHPQCQAHCLARARCLKSVYQIVYLLWHSSFQPFLLVRDKEKKGKLSQGHLFLMLFPLLKTHFLKKLALWHHVYYLCDFQTTLKSQASFILVLNL